MLPSSHPATELYTISGTAQQQQQQQKHTPAAVAAAADAAADALVLSHLG
jgi:hypothetical protein